MNKKEKQKLFTIKENARNEIKATEQLIEEIENDANFSGTEATIKRQIDFANKIKNEIYYKRGIEYLLRQLEEWVKND